MFLSLGLENKKISMSLLKISGINFSVGQNRSRIYAFYIAYAFFKKKMLFTVNYHINYLCIFFSFGKVIVAYIR